MPSVRLRPYVTVLILALVAASCGGNGETSTGFEFATTEATFESETSGETPAPTGASTLQSAVLESAEFTAELITADGTGRVFVVVDCDPVTGGNLITINPVGFAAGQTVSAVLEPAAGGSVTAQVGPDGSGVGARQTTLDETQYTLSVALDAETLETTFPGCG